MLALAILAVGANPAAAQSSGSMPPRSAAPSMRRNG